MAAKLGILVVHGMGSQKDPHFADGMIDEINRRVEDLGCSHDDLSWQPVYWADILQPQEDQLWEALANGHNLSFATLRRFVLGNLGDAVAYQREPDAEPDVYTRIHTRIHECIVSLHERLGGRDAPLVIMAHSLGGYMISNYIWDRQRHHQATMDGATNFEQMHTLSTIVTFGCNIAVFSLALKEYAGITFPPVELEAPLRSSARWLNFFDPQDILGYPIKPLCDAYDKNPQIEDREINVGDIFTSWNPLSHDQYWTDDDFTKPAANQLSALLRLL